MTAKAGSVRNQSLLARMRHPDTTSSPFRSSLAAVRASNIQWGDWLAPSLILVTPFVNYLGFSGYSLLSPESLAILAGLAGVGLAASMLISLRPATLRPLILALALVYIVDLQPDLRLPITGFLSNLVTDPSQCVLCFTGAHIATFLVALAVSGVLKRNAGTVFSTIFAVTLATTVLYSNGIGERQLIVRTALPVAESPRRDLPVVVHIVLDEHIGIEGIPDDVPGGAALRKELRDFYRDNGFRLYGRAFSSYFTTKNSLPSLVNGAIPARDMNFVTPVGKGYRLTENAWFDRLGAQGYRIHAYQSRYLDFCVASETASGTCTTYPTGSAVVFEDLDTTALLKARLLFERFIDPSYIYAVIERAKLVIRKMRSGGNNQSGIAKDRWKPPGVGALWARRISETLIDDLRAAEPGTAYFVHLLLPHGGFVLDDTCGLKVDLNTWYDHTMWGTDPNQRLSQSARSIRYVEYFKQVRCSYRILGDMLEALSEAGVMEEAIVILHGDHGSRITSAPPFMLYADHFNGTDLTDTFSTLFAIRAPGVPAGYDESRRSVQALFAELVLEQPIDDERETIFFSSRPYEIGKLLHERPISDFIDPDLQTRAVKTIDDARDVQLHIR